jgi:hypothetical protein
LETLSLWAAYTFGWSLVHGSLWSDFVFAVVIAWLISAVAGLLILPLVRRTSKRPANP